MNLLAKEIVIKEIEKVYAEHRYQQEINGIEADRNIPLYVERLKAAILSLEPLLYGEVNEVTITCMNMWDLCSIAFENILKKWDLYVDEEASNFDEYHWVIKRKQKILLSGLPEGDTLSLKCSICGQVPHSDKGEVKQLSFKQSDCTTVIRLCEIHLKELKSQL